MSRRRLRRDRMIFYLGIFLVAAGASGLVLGSWLHDVLRVPWVGTAYDTFGPLNATAAGIGAGLLIFGILAVWFGLRGGVVSPDAVAGA